jgi:hypothetical protein
MSLPIPDMLNDAAILDELLERGVQTFAGRATEIIGDAACHIRALADEVDRLNEGYRQMVQIVSDSNKAHYKMAKSILNGMDPRRVEDIENMKRFLS